MGKPDSYRYQRNPAFRDGGNLDYGWLLEEGTTEHPHSPDQKSATCLNVDSVI
jgi:hypothetical protein